MDIVLCVIAVIVVVTATLRGYALGRDYAYSQISSGVLMIANTEANEEPYMLLSLHEPVDQVAEKKYVIFRVDSENYSP